MANRIKLSRVTPHRKGIFEVTDEIIKGGVGLIPTDSQYALICDYKNKKGIERIRQIRQLGKKAHLTVMCHSLEHAAIFANLTDDNFKLIKKLIPGTYTFVLPATREVPKLLTHPKKRTVGIRVPDCQICLDLIHELGRPIMAITGKLPHIEHGHPNDGDRELFLSRFDKMVDVIIDDQEELLSEPTTIVDLTGDDVKILRNGLGVARLKEAVYLQNRVLEMDPVI